MFLRKNIGRGSILEAQEGVPILAPNPHPPHLPSDSPRTALAKDQVNVSDQIKVQVCLVLARSTLPGRRTLYAKSPVFIVENMRKNHGFLLFFEVKNQR